METLLTKYNTETFISDIKSLGLDLSDHQINQFLLYFEKLISWNEKINLTAITEYDEVMKKHFIDSLSACSYFHFSEKETLIDVGTGAGFPGIPLKIAFPNLKVTLLDSLNKRIRFLDEVISDLELSNIWSVHGRAEDMGHNKDYRSKFDVVVSRAVANISTLSEYCLPFCKKGGSFISYKSDKLIEELKIGSHAIELLGGKIKQQEEFYLPDSDQHRVILVIEKKKETPNRYPRKAGLPSKEPLN